MLDSGLNTLGDDNNRLEQAREAYLRALGARLDILTMDLNALWIVKSTGVERRREKIGKQVVIDGETVDGNARHQIKWVALTNYLIEQSRGIHTIPLQGFMKFAHLTSLPSHSHGLSGIVNYSTMKLTELDCELSLVDIGSEVFFNQCL